MYSQHCLLSCLHFFQILFLTIINHVKSFISSKLKKNQARLLADLIQWRIHVYLIFLTGGSQKYRVYKQVPCHYFLSKLIF